VYKVWPAYKIQTMVPAPGQCGHVGMGANTAFVDALDLGKALKSEEWHPAVVNKGWERSKPVTMAF
jgi:hypothetical protein